MKRLDRTRSRDKGAVRDERIAFWIVQSPEDIGFDEPGRAGTQFPQGSIDGIIAWVTGGVLMKKLDALLPEKVRQGDTLLFQIKNSDAMACHFLHPGARSGQIPDVPALVSEFGGVTRRRFLRPTDTGARKDCDPPTPGLFAAFRGRLSPRG